jgi:deoxycytidylate deaminase
MQREIAQEIADALNQAERKWLSAEVDPDELLSVILATRLGDLTEFGRAMHAEMSAILDAARNGRAVAGASLYVTTFPCHNCARHIIGAGIRNCVFLAPYVKSQAAMLHSDALVVATCAASERKVAFEPFVGVAPRRYEELFTWERRKHPDGTLLQWSAQTGQPRLADSEAPELRQSRPAYRVHEYLVMDLLTRVQDKNGPQVKKPDNDSNPESTPTGRRNPPTHRKRQVAADFDVGDRPEHSPGDRQLAAGEQDQPGRRSQRRQVGLRRRGHTRPRHALPAHTRRRRVERQPARPAQVLSRGSSL